MKYEEKMCAKARFWRTIPELIIYAGCDASGLGSVCLEGDSYEQIFDQLWSEGLFNMDKFNQDEYEFCVEKMMEAGKTQEEAEEAIYKGLCDNMSMTEDWDEDDFIRAISDYQSKFYWQMMTVQEVFERYNLTEEQEEE